MWKALIHIAMFATVLTLGAPAIGSAQSQPNSNTYTWVGALVSLDTAAMKMTVKTRVAYQEAMSQLKQFKPDQAVRVVWSGQHDYSEAVRQVRRFDANCTSDEKLVLPAEFVSAEAPNQYITIRVKVPDSSLAAIKAVKPDQWVAVTSRHCPSTDAEAVVSVRPYANTTRSD